MSDVFIKKCHKNLRTTGGIFVSILCELFTKLIFLVLIPEQNELATAWIQLNSKYWLSNMGPVKNFTFFR